MRTSATYLPVRASPESWSALPAKWYASGAASCREESSSRRWIFSCNATVKQGRCGQHRRNVGLTEERVRIKAIVSVKFIDAISVLILSREQLR